MLSCTEISFVISFFSSNFEKFGVKPGLPCTQLNLLTQNLGGKVILKCFTKMIAEQSPVIQYA